MYKGASKLVHSTQYKYTVETWKIKNVITKVIVIERQLNKFESNNIL